MKKSTLITEISLEDFLKLNLTAYAHRKCYGNDSVEIAWKKVDLNDIVLDNIKFSEEQNFKNRCICVAIHTEPSEKEIEDMMKNFNYVKSYREDVSLEKFTYEEAYESLLFKYSYLDKWLTRAGNQTYLLRCDVPHLYSEKRKFCTHDDYFDVPKKETKAIYLIHY